MGGKMLRTLILLIFMSFFLAGCSATGGERSWWPCQSYGEDDCEGILGCVWDPSGWCLSTTTSACFSATISDNCNDLGCVWEHDQCMSSTFNTCDAFEEKGNCEFAGCTWDITCKSTSLFSSCTQYETRDTCQQQGCYFDQNNKSCVSNYWGSCANLGEAGCADFATYCTWNESCKSNFTSSCGDFTTEDTCEGYSCVWAESAETCLPYVRTCSAYDSAQSCLDIGCAWDDNECKSMTTSACYEWRARATCETNNCYWEVLGDTDEIGRCLGGFLAGCDDAVTQKGCEDQGCLWGDVVDEDFGTVGPGCTTSTFVLCSDLTSRGKADCQKANCLYSDDTNACVSRYTPCDQYGLTNCPVDLGCKLGDSEQFGCLSNQCFSLELGDCLSEAGCMWNCIDQATGENKPCGNIAEENPGYCSLDSNS